VVLAAVGPVKNGALGAQTTEDVARAGEYVQEAFQARRDEDLGTYLDRLERAAALRPGHPELIYYIAGARALTGDSEGAIAELRRIADMGLGLQAEEDPDFGTLTADADFQAVVSRLQANRAPAGTSLTAFTIPGEPGFIPEGLAYDPSDRSFYVGSVHERKILKVTADGRVSEFAAPGFGGLMSVLGMRVDPSEGVLWVCTAGIPETRDLGDESQGRSAVFKFDLATGALLLHYHFSGSDQQRVVGDLALADDGDVYVTDARGSGIYRIRSGGDFLETFVQPGVFRSPQGIVPTPDQRGLFVADYSRGIYHVDRVTGEVTRLAHAEDEVLLGIDGLSRDGEGLIAVQNGTMPQRILRLELAEDRRSVSEVRVLASNLRDWDEPTLGLMIGDRFYYVANSQWNRFVDGRLPPAEDLTDPRIMWLNPR
jgi:sugar lactone lactonase YvrE